MWIFCLLEKFRPWLLFWNYSDDSSQDPMKNVWLHRYTYQGQTTYQLKACNCRTTLRFCRPSDTWAWLWVICTRDIFLRQPLGSVQSVLSLAKKILYRCEIARFNTPSYTGCLSTPRYRFPKTKSNCNNINRRKRYIFTSLHKYKADLSLK